MDAEGNPTDDPAVMFASPPGAFLPNGGADHGHKGHAMGLWVEALTAGLSGHGRADPKEGWGSTTFVQLLDPALFGGRAEFERQTTRLANACHATPPRPGVARVRLPGEQGLRLREKQLRAGLRLNPGVMSALALRAQAQGLSLPAALPIS